MTLSQINELREKLAKATQGEWKTDTIGSLMANDDDLIVPTQLDAAIFDREDDAAFIASAHNSMAELLDLAEWVLCREWIDSNPGCDGCPMLKKCDQEDEGIWCADHSNTHKADWLAAYRAKGETK